MTWIRIRNIVDTRSQSPPNRQIKYQNTNSKITRTKYLSEVMISKNSRKQSKVFKIQKNLPFLGVTIVYRLTTTAITTWVDKWQNSLSKVVVNTFRGWMRTQGTKWMFLVKLLTIFSIIVVKPLLTNLKPRKGMILIWFHNIKRFYNLMKIIIKAKERTW